MEIPEMTEKLAHVLYGYAEKFRLNRDGDYYALKIQEETGELTSAYLKLSGRARTAESTSEELSRNLRDEGADVLALPVAREIRQ